MKYQAGNAVSSFFYYMWNAWSKEECKIVFGGQYQHFWEKWCANSDKAIFGAVERFCADLSESSRELLVDVPSRFMTESLKERIRMIQKFLYVKNAVPQTWKSPHGSVPIRTNMSAIPMTVNGALNVKRTTLSLH